MLSDFILEVLVESLSEICKAVTMVFAEMIAYMIYDHFRK